MADIPDDSFKQDGHRQVGRPGNACEETIPTAAQLLLEYEPDPKIRDSHMP
jgi:hypothetical protein